MKDDLAVENLRRQGIEKVGPQISRLKSGERLKTISLTVECGGSGSGGTLEAMMWGWRQWMNGRDECVVARQVIAEADVDKKNTQRELNSLIKDLKVHIYDTGHIML